jgi:hypothetical protein
MSCCSWDISGSDVVIELPAGAASEFLCQEIKARASSLTLRRGAL